MKAERGRSVRTRAEEAPRRKYRVLDTVHPLLRMQRLVGNSAVAQVLQRDSPTREQNISALEGEITAAETDASKWKDVALRLNVFERSDIARMVRRMKVAQLQKTRTAVEQFLAGWPNQQTILTALDAAARKKKSTLRPSSGSIWAAYSQVGYNVWSGEPMRNKVWEHIGGSIGKWLENENTCAARVSWAFNNGGFDIGGGRKFYNDPKVTYKGKKGDGKFYIIGAGNMQDYLTALWGKPDAELLDNAAAATFEASLQPGQVAVFAGVHHSGIIRQGYSDAYVKSDPSVMPVAAWKLPL